MKDGSNPELTAFVLFNLHFLYTVTNLLQAVQIISIVNGYLTAILIDPDHNMVK